MVMKKYLFVFLVVNITQAVSVWAQPALTDSHATAAASNLYAGLHRIAEKGCLFGHQDDLAYGVNWRYQPGRSDVKDACGDYPAVYGYDLGGIENEGAERNLDGVPFKKIRQFIREGFERGGVITLSWHLNNPVFAGKSAWDTTRGTVEALLPGASHHQQFKEWLDRVADYVSSLKASNGTPIPVLFRPFHELTGNWFWWGKNNCSADAFKTLYRFVVYYLREVKQLHQLVLVYNTSDNFSTADEFLERYPGDDVVDLISFDSYQYGDSTANAWYRDKLIHLFTILAPVGKAHQKPIALAETGFETIPSSNWWTTVVLPAVTCQPVSYVLVWRNHGLASWNNKMHYYAPYTGHPSVPDFIQFYQHKKTLFEKDAAAEKLYQHVIIQ